MSDEKIIDMIRSSKASVVSQGLEAIYRLYFPLIRSLVVSNSGTEEHAADVFQEAVIVFHGELRNGRFLGKSSLKGFLYGISRNIWFKELRKKPITFVRLVDTSEDALREAEEFSDVVLPDEQGIRVKDFLNLLDAKCKTILEAFYYKEMSVSQIMDAFGIESEGAAKNRKYRCMQKLMKMIGKRRLKRSSFETD